jgi:3',5'-cyclic AMP phosphodiesterase CpdA
MLRHELQLDLRRLRTRLSRFDGLIVSGDIAFGGKPEEYEYAGDWIESIREQLGCSREGVMMTPGNHDVDRASIPDGDAVDLLHQQVRQAGSLEQCDAQLADILRDVNRAAVLLGPLNAYNAFAGKYGCQFTPDRPYWEREFVLGDGTKLRFRGITTNLLSSRRDDPQTHKMLYGGAQRVILREPNVRYAIVGHHPPSWTMEGNTADQVFSALTFLQIFGHEHEQWVTRIGESVRFIAGAVHPSRHESNWMPRYGAITISATDDTHLALLIYPRRWSTEEFKFMADYNSEGHDHRDYTVVVEPRQIQGDE